MNSYRFCLKPERCSLKFHFASLPGSLPYNSEFDRVEYGALQLQTTWERSNEPSTAVVFTDCVMLRANVKCQDAMTLIPSYQRVASGDLRVIADSAWALFYYWGDKKPKVGQTVQKERLKPPMYYDTYPRRLLRNLHTVLEIGETRFNGSMVRENSLQGWKLAYCWRSWR